VYEAKQSGVPSLVCREPSEAPLERLELMTRLRHAADEDEFTLHWQPIVDLDTGRACAAGRRRPGSRSSGATPGSTWTCR